MQKLSNEIQDSVRLLVLRERYSFTDIGLMFNVSRERVRQWCKTWNIIHPDSAGLRGLHVIRLWDDKNHCFFPKPIHEIRADRVKKNKRNRIKKRNNHKKKIKLIVSNLGPNASWNSIAKMIGKKNNRGVLSMYGGQYFDKMSYEERVKIFCEETGFKPKSTGRPKNSVPT